MTQVAIRMAERPVRLLIAVTLAAGLTLALIGAMASGVINQGSGQAPSEVSGDRLGKPDWTRVVGERPADYGSHDVVCPAGKECGP